MGEPFKVAKAQAIAQFERMYITALLTRTSGNITLAARLSGKDRSDISKLVRKYGLDRGQFTRAHGLDRPDPSSLTPLRAATRA